MIDPISIIFFGWFTVHPNNGLYAKDVTEAFAVKWKVEMEALGVQPYLTTYVFLIALAAEAGHEETETEKTDQDR